MKALRIAGASSAAAACGSTAAAICCGGPDSRPAAFRGAGAIYRITTPGYSKRDPVERWALPDRVFFACGACHILAYAFLERYGTDAGRPLWIRPAAGFSGNHIVVESGWRVFDDHGYAERGPYLEHTFAKAQRWWPGWTATLHGLPMASLVSEPLSRRHDGLHLMEPGQFLHDALPRARAFLDRFPPP